MTLIEILEIIGLTLTALGVFAGLLLWLAKSYGKFCAIAENTRTLKEDFHSFRLAIWEAYQRHEERLDGHDIELEGLKHGRTED